MSGKIHTSRLHVVQCDCGEKENDSDSIGTAVTYAEFEGWIRRAGWVKTSHFGWMCPICYEESAG